MKAIKFTLNGKSYGLYYNGMAMFEIQDFLGDISAIFEAVRGCSREKFEKLCRMVEILSIQYASAMQHSGYMAPDILRAEDLQAVASLQDIQLLQTLVIEAVNRGLSQEEADEDREIDLGLLELQKKTENPA